MEYKVITADNHLIEPPNTFVDRVPAKYKDVAPRLVRGKDGGDGWSLDGSIPETTIGVGRGLLPSTRARSEWQSPALVNRTRTSPRAGSAGRPPPLFP